MMDANQGFREISHTADWSLEAWAPDLAGLFEQAAGGMYALLQTQIGQQERVTRQFILESTENETLLVDFLGELLYLGETEELGFDDYELDLETSRLRATVRGGRIVSQSKEIKAVTYHNLAISKLDGLYRTTIVFDV